MPRRAPPVHASPAAPGHAGTVHVASSVVSPRLACVVSPLLPSSGSVGCRQAPPCLRLLALSHVDARAASGLAMPAARGRVSCDANPCLATRAWWSLAVTIHAMRSPGVRCLRSLVASVRAGSRAPASFHALTLAACDARSGRAVSRHAKSFHALPAAPSLVSSGLVKSVGGMPGLRGRPRLDSPCLVQS